MSYDIETLYGLLPAIYRVRDAQIAESVGGLLTPAEQAQLQALRAELAASGLDELEQRDLARLEEKRVRGPLKSLLTVVAEQIAGLEENIEQLYDDQFIETGAPWTVPYIADLVGHRALDPQLQERLGSARAEVANTIRFRRRKGTAAVLEELALDITGWDAAVVEYFLRLATTQYLNHLRPDHPGTADIRRAADLEVLGSPFDRLSHGADVRRIATRAGRYNIPNVAVFLWRIGSRRLTDVDAFRVDDRRFMFDPLGANTQLYNAAERATDVTRLAEPLNVPLPITRRALRRDLDDLYGPGLSISVQVGGQVLGRESVESCDLSDLGADPQTSAWAHPGQLKAAIDPVLGRLALPQPTAEPVRVTYYHGAVADLGGGEYDRSATAQAPPEPVRHVPADRAQIGAALADVNGSGTIQIAAGTTFAETPAPRVAANARLAVRAANQSRPVLALGGDLVVGGGDSGEVLLEGLLIAGGRVVVPAQVDGQPNRLQKLRIAHCTLVPGGTLTRAGQPGPMAISIEIAAANVALEIEHSIVGGLRVSEESSATISDSVIDALGSARVAYGAPAPGGVGGPLMVSASTIVGKVHAGELTASNAIFHAALGASDTWTAPVVVERRQAGHMRYCYVPDGSQLPPRYRCQPSHVQASGTRIEPRFASVRFGAPAYGQLHASCPAEIRCGGEDAAEMGAMYELRATQRAAGLRVRLDEYLRFGLEAGLLFAS